MITPQATEPLPLLSSVTTILDNLPAYQPPVPLRRRNQISLNPSEPIQKSPIQKSTKPALCSGDPSDCAACADDAFGKAFCEALGDKAYSTLACASCPNKGPNDTTNFNSMASIPEDGSSIQLTDVHSISLSQGAPSSSSCGSCQHSECAGQDSETMPCNEAWRRLKSHPNIAFADLSMLAEVVVRRTKCVGPHVLTSSESLALLEAMPDTTTYQSPSPSYSSQSRSQIREDDAQPIILVDPHAQYYEQQQRAQSKSASPPRLVPHDVLVECGKARLREVEVSGVRDALRLLDAQFGRQ
jgi:AP-1-like transcription factor